MTRPDTLQNAPDRFIRHDDGGLTVVNLFFLATIGILAGIAIDVANVVSARTQLQATADAAAHAALVEREWHSKQDATDKAIAVALQNMPADRFGDVLKQQNIVFGDYDRSTDTFTEDVNSRNAVLVQTERLTQNGNGISTFLLQFVGLWDWEVRTSAIFETFIPTCLLEGFVAQEVIDIQSNNSYFNGFCLHSNSYVTINNNNFFEPGTVVSMPDTNDLVVAITGNGEDKNEGLNEALREGKWFIKILDRVDMIAAGVQDRHSRYARSYINNYNIIDIDVDVPSLRQGNKYVVEPSDLQSRRIYTINCNKVDFKAGTYEKIVFIADCPIELSGGVVLIDAVVLTTYAGSNAFRSPAGIVLGKDDDCAATGGVQLVTKGDVDFSAGVQIFGSQIIAGGDVEFTSNADGLEGASIVAGGRIDSTSNMNFSFCGSGMEHNFLAEYFRLVK